MIGTLSMVATPIGNLEDMTLRAIRTLQEADVIFCEDTRVTGKLLAHFEITGKELVRADAEKESSVAQMAVTQLRDGKRIAYVSDAGTPGVSDPGGRLVDVIRAEVPEAIVEAIPGASSITAALSIAGLDTTAFTFLGFVPHKKGRQTFFASLEAIVHPVMFLESTHRIVKTLEALAETYPSSTLRIGRELSKLHEEMLIGSPADIKVILETEPVRQKGEFVIIFSKG